MSIACTVNNECIFLSFAIVAETVFRLRTRHIHRCSSILTGFLLLLTGGSTRISRERRAKRSSKKTGAKVASWLEIPAARASTHYRFWYQRTSEFRFRVLARTCTDTFGLIVLTQRLFQVHGVICFTPKWIRASPVVHGYRWR